MRICPANLLAVLLITGAMTPMTLTIAGCKNSPPQQAAVTAPEKTEIAQALPHTASSLPLAGLIGLLSLSAGFVLVIVTKLVA